MRAYRTLGVPALAALLLAAAPARGPAQVLLPGNPPLTREMIDLDHLALEVIFDLRFTDEQRRESERLLVEEWKGRSPAKKREWAKEKASWIKVRKFRNYGRNWQRTMIQARALAGFRKPGATERARWLLALYEAAYKPGSDRNPVLVDGDPPLTQQLVDRYRDYLEIILDLSLSGGFNADQRRVLQGYLVKDWKKMPAEERDDLLADLKTWADATAGADVARGSKAILALRPKLLAQLQTARDSPRSAWLLELRAQQFRKFEQMSADQRLAFETMRRLLGQMGADGHWEYRNGRSVWVPGR